MSAPSKWEKRLFSGKRGGDSYGIGLWSVRRVVDAYDGRTHSCSFTLTFDSSKCQNITKV